MSQCLSLGSSEVTDHMRQQESGGGGYDQEVMKKIKVTVQILTPAGGEGGQLRKKNKDEGV